MLWAEAVNSAAYLLNLTGPTSVEGKGPSELWYNKNMPDISHLRVFGTECYVHVPKQKRQKWDHKSTKGILVGYCGNKDGYRVYDPSTKKLVFSRDVQFPLETTCTPRKTDFSLTLLEDVHQLKTDKENYEEDEFFSAESLHVEKNRHNEEEETVKADTKNRNDEYSTHRLRDRSMFKPPTYLRNYAMLAETGGENPASYKDAIKSHNKRHWIKAMEDEMKSLAENDVSPNYQKVRNSPNYQKVKN